MIYGLPAMGGYTMIYGFPGLFPEEEVAPTEESVYPMEEIMEEAFKYYREKGFPYPQVPKHVAMQEINQLRQCQTARLVRINIKPIADQYHPHRFHASAAPAKSPVTCFSSDKDLRHAIKLQVGHGYNYGAGKIGTGYFGPLNWSHGTQACSNFRPGFALYVYRRFNVPGGVLLDTSTGYGGRLVGFFASDFATYIGFDPNEPTFEGNVAMASDLLTERQQAILYNQPIEDADPTPHLESCDFAFTSPPYFSKEHYSEDDTQSWVRYKTFKAWCLGFLKPMLDFQFKCLKPGAYSCINVDNVNIKSQVYPLVKRTVWAAEQVGFVSEGSFGYPMSKRAVGAYKGGKSFRMAKADLKEEPVLIFRKPE